VRQGRGEKRAEKYFLEYVAFHNRIPERPRHHFFMIGLSPKTMGSSTAISLDQAVVPARPVFDDGEVRIEAKVMSPPFPRRTR
jgi:hypothetical protein